MTGAKPRTHSGTELTDELAERLADEAEAGYDLDAGQILHAGRGRPSLSGDQTSPQVTFRLPGELRAKAEERAQREGKTLSALAREAMERYLAS
jgi:hypothetical protein